MKKKLKAHEEQHTDETWLIPYADLLTLLLALFIVLFSMSELDSKKYEQIMASFQSVLSGGTSVLQVSNTIPVVQDVGSRTKDADGGDSSFKSSTPMTEEQKRIQKEQENLEKLKEEIDDYIEQNNLSTQLITQLNNLQLILTISDNALYSSGSATLRNEARSLAIAIAGILDRYPDYEFVISGHTDNVPINTAEFQSNWDLSYKRALNFMNIILSNSTISPSQFVPIGYGEYRPVSTNDTVEGRAANRRVEVSITKNMQKEDQIITVN